MTKTLTIADIAYYRNAEGDIRGEIDLRRDGIWCSESFGIYASGNWEFKGSTAASSRRNRRRPSSPQYSRS